MLDRPQSGPLPPEEEDDLREGGRGSSASDRAKRPSSADPDARSGRRLKTVAERTL